MSEDGSADLLAEKLKDLEGRLCQLEDNLNQSKQPDDSEGQRGNQEVLDKLVALEAIVRQQHNAVTELIASLKVSVDAAYQQRHDGGSASNAVKDVSCLQPEDHDVVQSTRTGQCPSNGPGSENPLSPKSSLSPTFRTSQAEDGRQAKAVSANGAPLEPLKQPLRRKQELLERKKSPLAPAPQRPATPITPTRKSGAAATLAMQAARREMARSAAARAREERLAEQTSMLDYICWLALVLLGAGALALGLTVMSVTMNSSLEENAMKAEL